jgi:plastocyanin
LPAVFVLVFAAAAMMPAALAQGTIEGTVPLPESVSTQVMAKRYEVVSRGGVLSTNPPLAVVWIEGDFPPPASLPVAKVVQKDYMFDPTLLPIQVGTTVEFPNQDPEYHNVFSYSRPKRFDLGRYMPNERPIPTEVFDEPGLVTLRCDIHQHMRAIILIIDSPYFTKTEPSGAFRLEGLPAGDFVLKAWVDSKTTLEKPVTLVSGETLKVDF